MVEVAILVWLIMLGGRVRIRAFSVFPSVLTTLEMVVSDCTNLIYGQEGNDNSYFTDEQRKTQWVESTYTGSVSWEFELASLPGRILHQLWDD